MIKNSSTCFRAESLLFRVQIRSITVVKIISVDTLLPNIIFYFHDTVRFLYTADVFYVYYAFFLNWNEWAWQNLMGYQQMRIKERLMMLLQFIPGVVPSKWELHLNCCFDKFPSPLYQNLRGRSMIWLKISLKDYCW